MYRKIPLIRPGRIYGQRTNLMGLYMGWRGGDYIREEKRFNLQYAGLTFHYFLQYKGRILAFLYRARCEICSNLTIKTPEYVKLMINFKTKILLTSFWPLYC